MKSSNGLTHLSKDSVMKKLIETLPMPKWSRPDSLFVEIIENIIGQQLSSGPANIITARFWNLFPNKPASAKEILAIQDEKIRAVGTSWAKVKYIKSFCQATLNGLDLEEIKKLPDEEVIKELTKVKGIGKWTAEMILIFHLQRPDIFSLGDLGLRTAVSNLYGVDRNNLAAIEKISLQWRPYRSLASRFLWQSKDALK